MPIYTTTDTAKEGLLCLEKLALLCLEKVIQIFQDIKIDEKFYHKEEKLCLIRTCLYLDQKYPSLVIVCYCLNSYHETLEVIHLQDRLEAKSNHPQTN